MTSLEMFLGERGLRSLGAPSFLPADFKPFKPCWTGGVRCVLQPHPQPQQTPRPVPFTIAPQATLDLPCDPCPADLSYPSNKPHALVVCVALSVLTSEPNLGAVGIQPAGNSKNWSWHCERNICTMAPQGSTCSCFGSLSWPLSASQHALTHATHVALSSPTEPLLEI